MTRNRNAAYRGGLRRLGIAMLMVAAVSGATLAVTPLALAEEVNDAPGTYQLPLRAAEASTKMAETTTHETVVPMSADEAAVPTDPIVAAASTASDEASSASAAEQAASAATSAPDETTSPSATHGSDGSETSSASPEKEAAQDDESAEHAVSPSTPSVVAPKATATASAEPVSYTISGMKYLEGRTLQAGEFTFRITADGAAQIPLASQLPSQLRSSTLTDAEKYELLLQSGLTYYPSTLQSLPSSSTAVNAEDGTVTFDPLTFDLTSLGETSTRRHHGTVFSYTVVEEPPRAADGSLLDGVTRDAQGRYVYQGVTYDSSVKHIYLYVYEAGDSSGEPVIEVMALGDVPFDGRPAKAGAGVGEGFLNIFNGAVLDIYDGTVFLPDGTIAAGEFNFDVKEVAEDGTILDDRSVSCEAADNGSQGAEVPLIVDEIFGEPGRFFYAVTQIVPARAETDIAIDETSYIITVDVTQDSATDDLTATIANVRKKAADSSEWVDVDLTAQPTPVVWENRVKAATDSSDENAGAAGSDKPAGDADHAGDAADSGDGKEVSGTESAEGPAASDVTSDSDTNISSSMGQGAAASGSTQADREATATKAASDFAQTGDDLGWPMLIAFAVVIASGVLVLVSRRHQQ